MKMNALVFVIGFVIAFGGGYLFFGGNGDNEAPQPVQETTPETEEVDDEEANEEEANDEVEEADEDVSDETEEAEEPEEREQASVDIQPMTNCLSCHAVDSLGIAGGEAGPDLSPIYAQIEGKHGKDLDSFLQEPTTQVMVTVLEDNPLSDEDREAIVDILSQASEEME